MLHGRPRRRATAGPQPRMYDRARMNTVGRQRLWQGGGALAICLALGLGASGFAQQPPTRIQETPADAKARETFQRVCLKCHPAERVAAEGRSRAQWENTMISMQTSRGAVITPDEFDIILDFLT